MAGHVVLNEILDGAYDDATLETDDALYAYAEGTTGTDSYEYVERKQTTALNGKGPSLYAMPIANPPTVPKRSFTTNEPQGCRDTPH